MTTVLYRVSNLKQHFIITITMRQWVQKLGLKDTTQRKDFDVKTKMVIFTGK